MVGVWIALGVLVLLAVVIIVMVWKLSKRRQLREKDRRKLLELWILVESIDDPVRRIIEADKIVHSALGLLGYKGSMGDALKAAGPRFSDQNALWRAHKLRNIVAHELQQHPNEEETKRALRAFRAGLKDLGM